MNVNDNLGRPAIQAAQSSMRSSGQPELRHPSKVRNAEFDIGIYGCPSPYIAPSFGSQFNGGVPCFGSDECQYLIALKASDRKAPHMHVMMGSADIRLIEDQPDYGVLGGVCQTDSEMYGIALNQR